MNHTPTPWESSQRQIWQKETDNCIATLNETNCSSSPSSIKKMAQEALDAAHIVKCVNMHDELVEALESVIKHWPSDHVDVLGTTLTYDNTAALLKRAKETS